MELEEPQLKPDESQTARRIAAGCPWCGDGTQLLLRGDGIGGVSLWCTRCGCKGPTVPISGDFGDADEAAIDHWSSRAARKAAVDTALLSRVQSAIAVATLLNGGHVTESLEVPVKFSDLANILSAAGAKL